MAKLEKISAVLFAALIATLPFELRVFPVLSNLQWLFLGIALASTPLIVQQRHRLLADRRVMVAGVFVLVQCAAALATSDFRPNAAKGALRIAAGFVLLCATLCLRDRHRLMKVWCVAAGTAAVYGLLDYIGFGIPDLFRAAEFYVGDVLRLSGSFEYPNTAAAFFAMSLPIVWLVPKNQTVRYVVSSLVLLALFLTYSRGALVAVVATLVVWGVVTRSKGVLALCGVGAALYLALALVQPFVIQRLRQAKPDKALAADYKPEFNLMHHRPKETAQLNVVLTNTGAVTWLPDGDMPVTLSYHWYDTGHKKLATVAAIETSLPHPVRTHESVSVNASFYTPHEPGLYLLIWDLAQKGGGWFSASGVVPAVVESDIQPSNEVWHGNGDVSRWHRPERGPTADATIARRLLWESALKLTIKSPVLGVGPDNFRLLYGRPLGFSNWDTNVRSNSLYLELLAGSGVLGLLAFGFMMASIPWKLDAVRLALGIFLLHGIADVFLMTTPIYFAFWILMGQADADPV